MQGEAPEANMRVPSYGYYNEGPDFNSHTGSYTKTEPYHSLPPMIEEDPEDHEEANAQFVAENTVKPSYRSCQGHTDHVSKEDCN